MSLIVRWREWRITSLSRQLKVEEADIEVCEKAENTYNTNYYTERKRWAVRRRVQIASALEYHKGRLVKL